LKISIIPRGVGALRYTIQHPTEDRFVLAASELRHRIAVLMGGRPAEVLLFEATFRPARPTISSAPKPAPQGFLSGQDSTSPWLRKPHCARSI
jgi:ATP-dependent Zn protease